MPTLYQRLGVAPEASDGELRRAYVALARRHHPDAGGDPDDMRALNEAWAVLSDPTRRRAYDRTIAAEPRLAGQPMPEVDLTPEADLADLLDDRPVRVVSTRPSVAVAPAALFASALGTGVLGIMLAMDELLAFAGFLGFLSVIAVAAVALLTLRGPR